MKERENKPEQISQKKGRRMPEKRPEQGLARRTEGKKREAAPAPQQKARRKPAAMSTQQNSEGRRVPKNSTAAKLAEQKTRRKAAAGSEPDGKQILPAKTLVNRLKSMLQGQEKEPDEMEKIYGDRPILGASSREQQEKGKPQFAYLFEDNLPAQPKEEATVAAPPKAEPESFPIRDSQYAPKEQKESVALEAKEEIEESPMEGNTQESNREEALKDAPSLEKGKKEENKATEHSVEETESVSLPEKKEAEELPPIPAKEGPQTPPIPSQTEKKAVGEDLIDEGDEDDSGEEDYRLKREDSSSRYEKLFGSPKPVKNGKKAPASSTGKKEQRDSKQSIYSAEEGSAIVLDNEEVKEALLDEYEEYRRAQKKEPPIPPEPNKKKIKKETAASSKPSRREDKKEKFSIFGEIEPDDGEQPLPSSASLPDLDDYTEPDDAFSVRAEIMDNMRAMLLRTAVTGITAVLAILITLLYHVELPLLEGIKSSPYWYLTGNLLLLVVSAAFCHVPMRAGMRPLLRMHGNSDTGVAFAAWVSLLHGVTAFFNPNAYLTGDLNVYGVLVILGLFLNSLGKLMMVRRVYANFKYVSSPDPKFAVKIVPDEKYAEKLSKGMGLDKPIIAYQRKTSFLTNFLRLSYEPDPSEQLAGKIAPLGVAVSILVGAGCLLLWDIQRACTALSITACICVPMCSVLSVNQLMRRLGKRALRAGSMLVGYPGVRQFADTNAVILDASQLYPRGSVALHGMKGFSGERIDEAILEAGAVMCQAGGPMAATFEQIIKGKSELLPKVDSLSYEDEMGIVGWVHGRRVLVGNRRLLEEHGVTPPDRELEEQYTQNGRQITYLATAGELRALFVTSYIPDENMIYEMQKLEEQGVCFLVRTCDPNVTARMVSDHFRVYYRSVRIVPDQLSQFYVDGQKTPEKQTRAYMATRGRPTAFLRILESCIRVRNHVLLSLVLQMIAVVLGFVLTAFLIFASGLGQLGTLEMLIYTLFWIAAILIVPGIRRP